MKRTTLYVAVVTHSEQSAWAFTARESAPRVRDRFVHSGTGFGFYPPVVGGFLGLAAGLQALRERDLTSTALTVWLSGVPEVFVAMTTPATPLGEVAAMLCEECRDEVAAFSKIEFRESPCADYNPADRSARGAWESGTFLDFPPRPTRRPKLPAFTREATA